MTQAESLSAHEPGEPPEADAEPGARAVTLADLAAYAVPAGMVSTIYTMIVIAYAKYATDTLLVSGTVMGTILLLSRVWDAVSDPMVGYLSDRTQARIGRRKSWIFASPIPMGIFGYAMWAPPPGLEGAWEIAWLSVAVFGFFTAYTGFEVPHMALAAEVSPIASDRNRLFGARQLAKTGIGLLVAAIVGPRILEAGEGAYGLAQQANVALAVLMAAAVLYGTSRLPAEPVENSGRGAGNPFKAVRDIWSNRYARLLLLTYLVESFGMGGIGVLTPYVVEYVMLRPDLISEMLGVYILAGVLGVPLWIRLARHFEKRKLWLFAMAQAGVGFGILVFIGENGWPLMVASSVIAGSAGSCGSVLGASLKAEVIDYDEYLTGERKEGAYFAGWAFVHKLAGGLMLGLTLYTLDAVGYVANEVQTDTVKFWMIALMGGAPIVGYLIGIAVFRRFDLSEGEHRRIRAELDARRAPTS